MGNYSIQQCNKTAWRKTQTNLTEGAVVASFELPNKELKRVVSTELLVTTSCVGVFGGMSGHPDCTTGRRDNTLIICFVKGIDH